MPLDKHKGTDTDMRDVTPVKIGHPTNDALPFPFSSELVSRARKRLLEGYYDHPDVLLVLAEILITSGALGPDD